MDLWFYRGKPVSELTDAECRGVLASLLLLLERERGNHEQERKMAELFQRGQDRFARRARVDDA